MNSIKKCSNIYQVMGLPCNSVIYYYQIKSAALVEYFSRATASMAKSKYRITRFDGKGYHSWKTRLLILFCVENLDMAHTGPRVLRTHA